MITLRDGQVSKTFESMFSQETFKHRRFLVKSRYSGKFYSREISCERIF